MISDLRNYLFTTNEMEINWTYILWSALACLVIAIVFRNKHAVGLPIINDYPWDFLRKRARSEYLYNSRGLIAEGFKKFHGPFQLVTTQGTRVILPSEYTDWAKNSRDLDHQALVLDDYFADYPGFDGNAVVVNPNRMLINVTKSKLSQNSGSIKIMSEQLDDVLKTTWTESKDWHSINWSEDTVHFISRMATSIFSGEGLATNEEWQEIMITYTINLFQGVGALRSWPALLRPLAHRFLPYSKICMQQVKRTRTIVANHLEERNREKEAAIAEGIDLPVYEDIFTWMEEAANGAPVDHAAVQLAFAISALHTTTEALRQILLDICLHPELIEPLREEIEAAMNEHGPTISGLFRMQLLDSVMKESQRMKAPPVGIERRAVRATVLPDGTAIPYGTVIAVDASDMWSTEYHIDPEIYDGYRFLRLRETGGKHTATSTFVSSTKEHNIFGGGRSICPGRFFAANEIKLALAHILLKYDIRLKDGSKLKDIHYGFYRPTDMQAEVEVRRRDGGDFNVFTVK